MYRFTDVARVEQTKGLSSVVFFLSFFNNIFINSLRIASDDF